MSTPDDALDDLINRRPAYALLSPVLADQWIDDATTAIQALRARAEEAERQLADARKYRKAFLDVDCEGIIEKHEEDGYCYVPICRLLRAEVVALRNALRARVIFDHADYGREGRGAAQCEQCRETWWLDEPERHALGCLAARAASAKD